MSGLRFRLRRTSSIVALLVLAAGCSGDGGTEPPKPPTTGSLVIASSGLPASLSPSYTIVSPSGVTRTAAAGDTVRNLPPGVTVIRSSSPNAPGIGRWLPFTVESSVTIVVGTVASQTVQYAAAAIVFSVATSGLPPGAAPAIRLTAPNSVVYPTSAGTPFETSIVGTWTIQGQSVSAANFLWTPSGAPIARAALPGDTIAVTLPFTVASGAIEIRATGLADGVRPLFTLTNGSASTQISGPGIVADIPPGTWRVTTTPLNLSGVRYAPAVVTQDIAVTLGELATRTVAFTQSPILANFAVESAYLTQAIQTRDGGATLVAGREALLRVFLIATDRNDWRPLVRAKLYQGTSLVETIDISPTAASIDTVVNEGVLASSWNVRIPANRIVPGLRVRIEADPAGAITADHDAADNVWPRSGTSQEIPVMALPVWKLVLVPVVTQPTGVSGSVTDANKDSYTSMARRVLPVADVQVTVRAPFSSSGAALQSNDTNNAWTALLSEVRAARALEAQPNEYWYGLVKVDYSSGIAGYGYVPGKVAIGWDYLPSGDRVAAHEWGHNMSRPHAPCGNVGNADVNFPHAGGIIGTFGWNSLDNSVVDPSATDLMGYCSNQWISAYNWQRMLLYRASSSNNSYQPTQAGLAMQDATDRLLVWGTITNGRIDVEPAFVVPGRGNGAELLDDLVRLVRIDALDSNGGVVLSTVTSAPLVDHAAIPRQAFSATLPISPAQQALISSIRVTDLRSPLSTGVRRRSALAAATAAAARAAGETELAAGVTEPTDALIRVGRSTRGVASLEWNTARYPRALVRDAASGLVLGFLRENATALPKSSGDFEIILSDGVRSRTARVSPR